MEVEPTLELEAEYEQTHPNTMSEVNDEDDSEWYYKWRSQRYWTTDDEAFEPATRIKNW